jgi:hypothetical protein
MSLIGELLNTIEAEASREIAPDLNEDFNPMDCSGGNFDDAYEMGVEHGYVLFARELLDLISRNR